jgi:electron-transferring-flavoprotein dehydrogenase
MSPVERESMEVDVLYIGAGPASLASSLHLMNQVKASNQRAESEGKAPIEPPTVLVLEKGAAVGDHLLSGAVMNPRGIRELVPDFVEAGFPTEYVCDYAGFWIFHPKGKISAPGPFVPPNFRKKGYHVVSLNKVAKWMAERCEEAGVEIYPGFAGDEILTEGDRVIGVRTGDMGVDKDGKPKGTFQPGMDIFAKVTVLGEGVRGSLSKQLIADFDLDGMNPQTFETGVKELWRIDPKKHQPGRVVHGLGIPQIFDGFHGMWLYDMQDDARGRRAVEVRREVHSDGRTLFHAQALYERCSADRRFSQLLQRRKTHGHPPGDQVWNDGSRHDRRGFGAE